MTKRLIKALTFLRQVVEDNVEGSSGGVLEGHAQAGLDCGHVGWSVRTVE